MELNEAVSGFVEALNRAGIKPRSARRVVAELERYTRLETDGDYRVRKEVLALPVHVQGRLLEWLEHVGAALRVLDRRYRLTPDIVIITALEVPELSAVLKLPVGERAWVPVAYPGEPEEWHAGTFERGARRISVAATSARAMGMPATAVVATKAIMRWRPKLIMMTGMAAGAEGEVEIGQVLIPERIYVHDSGKVRGKKGGRKDTFLADRWTAMIDPLVLADVQALEPAVAARVVEACLEEYGVGVSKCPVSYEPLATGNIVVDSDRRMESITQGDRKTAGVEMEAYALLLAARRSLPRRSKGLVVKAVTDFGVGKTDDHQEVAAYLSARFAYEFALATEFAWAE